MARQTALALGAQGLAQEPEKSLLAGQRWGLDLR
jgi:hypothetical protein